MATKKSSRRRFEDGEDPRRPRRSSAAAAELDAEVAKQAEASKISVEEAKEYFEKNGFLHYLEHDVRDRKLADFLLGTEQNQEGQEAIVPGLDRSKRSKFSPCILK